MVTQWVFLYDWPAGRVLGVRGRSDEDAYYELLRLDTDGVGEVWRGADDGIIAFDVPADPQTHPVDWRPDLPMPAGILSLQHPDRRYVLWQEAQPGPVTDEGTTYDVHDLVRAYLDLDRWADAPRRRQARRRYEALTRALGVPGRGPADQAADPATLVDTFFRGVVDQFRAARSPFDGLLEAPSAIIDAHQEHGKAVSQSMAAAREALIPVLVVLVEAGWAIKPGAIVTREQLLDWGWDMDESLPELDQDEW